MQEFQTNQTSEPIRLYDNTCESDKITYSNISDNYNNDYKNTMMLLSKPS